MRKPSLPLLIAMLATASCGKKPEADTPKPESGAQSHEKSTSPEVVERIPEFPAKIWVESRSPEKGTVRFSGSIASSHQFETKKSAVGTSTKFKTEKTEMSFDLLDGKTCKITPVFIGQKDGLDEWKIELRYHAPKEEGGALLSQTSPIITFDGKTPATVAEDDGHTIIFRPSEVPTPESWKKLP